jgi:hypothetical protein
MSSSFARRPVAALEARMQHDHSGLRDIERELVDSYPDLALLLRRAATLHAWQPSTVGDQVLRRLAAAVAVVLERRMSADEAERYLAEISAETQQWLGEQRRRHGQSGTRER